MTSPLTSRHQTLYQLKNNTITHANPPCLYSSRWGTPSNGAAARNNNAPTSSSASAGGGGGGGGGSGGARAPQRTRGRVVRAVGRGRGSGVIVGARPLVPASVVPEDLINQVRDC